MLYVKVPYNISRRRDMLYRAAKKQRKEQRKEQDGKSKKGEKDDKQ